MKRNLLLSILAPLLLLLVLAGCGSLSEDITPPPGYESPTAPPEIPAAEQLVFPVLPPDPARGEPLFAENCSTCHGSAGLGDGRDASDLPNPVPAIGDIELARQATPTDWYLIVANGNIERYMPPFASLSVPQRWDVIAYAFSLSASDEELSRGQKLYAEQCASCHGERGKGDGPDAGELSASPVDFTDQAFMGYQSATDLYLSISGGMGEMHAFADLGEEDRWALTTFLRSLTFAVPEVDTVSEEGESDATPGGAASPEGTPLPVGMSSEAPAYVFVQVVNGSGGDLSTGAEVTLHGYDGMEEIFTRIGALPEDGLVVFEEIPMPEGRVFLATIEYDQVVYGSNFVQAAADIGDVNLDLMVFDSTTDSTGLVIERLHIFFDFVTPDSVQVIELVLLSNTGEQTVIALDDQPVIEFELPEGALNLEVDENIQLGYMQTAAGFGVGSIRPAAEPYEITFAFEMPYDKKKADISLPIPLDTVAAIMIAPEDGVKIKGDQLRDGGSRDFQGVLYRTYHSDSLKAGETFSFTLSGLPRLPSGMTSSSGTDNMTNLMIGLGALGAALIGAGIYVWRRNRSEGGEWDDAEAAEVEILALAETPEELMDAIIALDELYQAGELPEAAYLERREELKARLKEMARS
ncbi:MAG: c-type cytochrome [Chloroflexi bacterium]|nr:c-type cytochrome [Chloroflexota bacterium]